MNLLQILMQAGLTAPPDGFELFYTEYYDYLYNFVLKMVFHRESAHDLTQETFTRILRQWGKLKSERDRKNYLFTIATNLCRDRARKKDKAQHLPLEPFEDFLEAEQDHGSRVERRAELQQFEEILEQLVLKLPEEERMLLYMKRLDNMTYENMSRVTGISVRTLKRRVKSILDGLTAAMERQGILAGEVSG